MQLKIYSDKNLLPKNFVCHMMLPFWPQVEDKTDPDFGRFDRYILEGQTHFKFEDLEHSDFFIYPASPTYDLKKVEELQILYPNKKIILFFNDDSDRNFNFNDNVFLFRTSFYKSLQRKNEFALPAWSADCGQMPLRNFEKKPTIGFCGQSQNPYETREMGLQHLEKSPLIKTNFIRRNGFWGGRFSKNSTEFTQKIRNEFIDNIKNSDYVFCARGGGNFSYRLYETMMCGRIPVLINTDCVLPFDFLISWKNLFPIIEQQDLKEAADVLLKYHNSLTSEQFVLKQNEMRSLWEHWLSPHGFFSNLNKHF